MKLLKSVLDLIELDFNSNLLHPPSVQIIASAHYMLSELFQLDEPPEEDGEESLRAGGSEDSYSDEDREEEEEDLIEDSDENGSYANCSSPQNDSKAVAVIRSVGELSVPEKYTSTHQIRVSATLKVFSTFYSSPTTGERVEYSNTYSMLC